MKNEDRLPSVRARINTWYSIIMSLLGLILGFALIFSQNYVSMLNMHKTVVSQVEKNADEVEYENGTLEIESDFMYNSKGVLSLVLAKDGRLLAGEYRDLKQNCSAKDFPLPGESGDVFSMKLDGTKYCIYDKKITFNLLEFSVDANTGEIIDWSSETRESSGDEIELSKKVEEGCSLSFEEAFEKALLFASLDRADCKVVSSEVDQSYGMNVINIEMVCSDKLFDDVIIRGIAADESFSFFAQKYLVVYGILLAAYIAFAVLIGFIISGRAFKSVDRLSETVSSIATLEDIKNVQTISPEYRELRELSDSFNLMLGRLNQSFEAEKHFNENASHELKTPIAVILAQCELLLDSGDLNDEERKFVLSIQKQSIAMNRLVGEMLALARIEQGREHFEFSLEDFSVLVRAVCDDISLLSDKKIHVDVQDGIFMNMDVPLMTRLVDNLVTNAVKYGKEGGNVWVGLRTEDDNIVLTVKDDGIGIAEEDKEKIFSRFYRVDKARSRETGSSGLGLSFVEEISRIHHGTIELKSELGKGSEFILTFKK